MIVPRRTNDWRRVTDGDGDPWQTMNSSRWYCRLLAAECGQRGRHSAKQSPSLVLICHTQLASGKPTTCLVAAGDWQQNSFSMQYHLEGRLTANTFLGKIPTTTCRHYHFSYCSINFKKTAWEILRTLILILYAILFVLFFNMCGMFWAILEI